MKKSKPINQLAMKEETETHINLDYFSKIAKCYTNSAKVMRRLEKKKIPFTEEHLVNGKVFGRSYELPFDDMNVFLSKTVMK